MLKYSRPMLINDKPPKFGAPSTRILLAGGIVGPLLFVGVVLVEGAARPGYEPMHRFGSELALGDRGWVMITNFIVAGLLILGFAAGLRRTLLDGRGARVAPVLAALFGLCLVVGGVFVIDPMSGNPENIPVPPEPTLHGWIHDANLLPFYLSLVSLMAVMAHRFASEPGGRPWMWCSVAAAFAVAVAVATALYSAETGHFHGLWQRISLTIGLIWIAAVAWRVKTHSRPSRPTPTTSHAH